MERTERIRDFAEQIKTFFLVFDAAFLYDDQAEEMMAEVLESLQEKISRNESALPVIMALGGQYDRGIDQAKLEETDALLRLLRARKALRAAVIRENERSGKGSALLKELYGI